VFGPTAKCVACTADADCETITGKDRSVYIYFKNATDHPRMPDQVFARE
jgi:hypothetical protein